MKHEDKIVSFGGCFMFDKKRQVRECTNQVTVYDTLEATMTLLKTKAFRERVLQGEVSGHRTARTNANHLFDRLDTGRKGRLTVRDGAFVLGMRRFRSRSNFLCLLLAV